MRVVTDQPESVMEVVQTERGGWTPYISELLMQEYTVTLHCTVAI